jgi:phage terminase small subunit
MSGLTPKQQAFVREYLIDFNGTQAATRAGYSPKTAQEQSSRLLSNVMVQSAVQEAINQRSERTQITQDMVLKELALIGFARMKQYASWTSETVDFVASDELLDGEDAAISEITERRKMLSGEDGDVILDRQLRIKLHDKRAALVDIAKHLGMFAEKLAEENSADSPQIVGLPNVNIDNV